MTLTPISNQDLLMANDTLEVLENQQEENIEAEQNQEVSNLYYAIYSQTGSRLTRKNVGRNAIFDHEKEAWFFQFKEEAELIVKKYSKKESNFHIVRLPSNILQGLLYGSKNQKNAIRARSKYENLLREFKKNSDQFDLDCYNCRLDKSIVLDDFTDELSDLEKKSLIWLKKKWNELEKEKNELESERIKCERLEKASKSKNFSNKLENDLFTIKIISGELHNSINSAEYVLTSNKLGIFQRGGQLVRIIPEASSPKKNNKKEEVIRRSPDSLLIAEVDPIYLTELLSKNANWMRFDERKDDWIARDCPEKIAKHLIARREWNVPVLTGIIQAPTLRADGSILEINGHDEETGLYFDSGNILFNPVPVNPSKEDALNALNVLNGLLKDFPFENEESRSVIISAILTALVRKSLRTAPLHGITAPKMASGKSLLADVIGLICTGKNNSVIPQSENEAEEKKRLLAVLAEGDSIICYDNIEHPFGSPALCSILTQQSFKDRLLGLNRSLSVPTNAMFLATGNNLIFVGDTSTRVILCRLDPQCEHPEERSFDIDLRQHILNNRTELVHAALTILRAYHVAGRPKQNIKQFGRFEDWSNWVRSALIWLGMEDPCTSRKEIENSDPIRLKLGNLLEIWFSIFDNLPIKVEALIKKTNETDERSQELKEILSEILPKGITSRNLGNVLSSYKNRIEKGFRLEISGTQQRYTLWRVLKKSESSESR